VDASEDDIPSVVAYASSLSPVRSEGLTSYLDREEGVWVGMARDGCGLRSIGPCR